MLRFIGSTADGDPDRGKSHICIFHRIIIPPVRVRKSEIILEMVLTLKMISVIIIKKQCIIL